MGGFFKSVTNIIKFFWLSLRPILFVAFVFGVLALILVGYDQYKLYEDRKKGAELIDQITVTPSCDEIVNSGQGVLFELMIKNANSQEVILKALQINNNLFETEDNKIVSSVKVSPQAVEATNVMQFVSEYVFQPPLRIEPSESTVVKITFKTLSTQEVGATPHTIVVYDGQLNLLFEHEIKIQSNCRYQVRYS